MRIIETKDAPAAIGPYSQAIVAGGIIYTSGQIPIDPSSGTIEASGIEEQTRQVIRNLEAVLKASGSSLERVVKTTCFLKNIGDFAVFNSIYAEAFTSKPARSCVEAAAGVGMIGIADADTVDLSNLQRQIIHIIGDLDQALRRIGL